MKYAKKDKHFEDIDSLIEDGLSLDHFLSESMAKVDESRSALTRRARLAKLGSLHFSRAFVSQVL